MYIQLAPGTGHINGIKNGDFQKHACGTVTDPGTLAAHNAGNIIRAVIITDHQHIRHIIIGFFIQGEDLLPFTGKPQDQLITCHLIRIICMERTAQINHHIIGDVNKS